MDYCKIIDGKTIIRARNQIVVKGQRTIIDDDGNEMVVDMQTLNPSEEMILADGWKEYVIPEPTIDDYRRKKKNEMLRYDSSEEVNQFTVQGKKVWLDKATRSGLMLRFQAEQAIGRLTTTLWYEGMMFGLPIASAMQMLLAIEVYASECYDNTQRHLAAVDKLETKEEIEAYDYKIGYPQRLEF